MTASDKPDKSWLQQTARDAWLSVLGVFTSAESEVHRATTSLLESLGLKPDAQGRTGSIAAELMARMRKNREEFERKVDEGVRAAIDKVRQPIDKEIATIRARVERVQARIEEQRRARAERRQRTAKPPGEGEG